MSAYWPWWSCKKSTSGWCCRPRTSGCGTRRSHDSKDKLQAVNRRLQAESDENARLRKALDEAHAKLDAVTHIERSINDRGTSEPPHTP